MKKKDATSGYSDIAESFKDMRSLKSRDMHLDYSMKMSKHSGYVGPVKFGVTQDKNDGLDRMKNTDNELSR